MNETVNAANVFPLPTRPMEFGELLDRIFQLLRRNFWLFMAVAGVPAGAFILFYGLMMAAMIPTIGLHPQTPPDPRVMLMIMVPAYLVFIVLMLITYPLYAAAGSYAGISVAEGRKVTAREAYGVAWKRAGSYIWLYVLRALCIMVPYLMACALVGAGIFMLSRGEGWDVGGIVLIILGVLGFFGTMVLGIIVMLRWALSFPASVVEGLTAWAAMKRSSQLTVGAKGRIFLVALVVTAFVYVFQFAFTIAIELLAAVGVAIGMAKHISITSPEGYIPAGLFAAGLMLGMFFFVAILYSSYSVSFSVLYLDQRVRLEGYDIERMMQAAGMEQAESGGAPA